MSKDKWNKIFLEGKEFAPLNLLFLDKILKTIQSLRKRKGEINQPKNVVDFGSGTGDTAVKFAEKGFDVQGIDWSEVALTKATKFIKEKKLEKKINLTLMDLEKIEDEKIIYNPADIVLCKLTFAFINNKEKFLESVKKILSEYSILILITPVLYPDINYTTEDKPGIAVNWENILEILNKKFSYVNIFHHNYFSDNGDEVTFLLMK